MVVPKELVPANNSTALPASAVPVNVGVLSLVRLSLLELPVSELVARSGLDGVVVAVSTVRLRAADGSLSPAIHPMKSLTLMA